MSLQSGKIVCEPENVSLQLLSWISQRSWHHLAQKLQQKSGGRLVAHTGGMFLNSLTSVRVFIRMASLILSFIIWPCYLLAPWNWCYINILCYYLLTHQHFMTDLKTCNTYKLLIKYDLEYVGSWPWYCPMKFQGKEGGQKSKHDCDYRIRCKLVHKIINFRSWCALNISSK